MSYNHDEDNKTMQKLVSILIPVFNRESLIEQAIISAVTQTYTNLEIIIVDNCSTDDTFFICQKYALTDDRIRLYQNERNIGLIPNLIRCLDYAKGVYVKFLFSDDRDSNDFVSKSVALMTSDTGFVIAGVSIGQNSYKWGAGTKDFSAKEYLNDVIFRGGPLGTPGNILLRASDARAFLKETVGAHSFLKFDCRGAGPDLLLMLEVAHKYKKIRTISEILCFFGSQKDSVSVNFVNENADRYAACYHMAKVDFIVRNGDKQELKVFFAYIWALQIKKSRKYIDFHTALGLSKIDISNDVYVEPDLSDLLKVLFGRIYRGFRDICKI